MLQVPKRNRFASCYVWLGPARPGEADTSNNSLMVLGGSRKMG